VGVAPTNFEHLYSNAKSIFVLVKGSSSKTLKESSLLFPIFGVALDYFEPFINKAKAYQNFDFLKDWSAFVQKLSNLFGSYSPEDDDENAIVSISFPNNGKAINYFIQFAKFQN